MATLTTTRVAGDMPRRELVLAMFSTDPGEGDEISCRRPFDASCSSVYHRADSVHAEIPRNSRSIDARCGPSTRANQSADARRHDYHRRLCREKYRKICSADERRDS